GEIIELARQLQNFAADSPIKVFGQAALLKRQVAKAEKFQCRIKRLLGIVIALQKVALVNGSVRFEEIDQRLFRIFGNAGGEILLAEAADTEDVKHKQAVIRGDRAAALGDDGGMRDFALVADVLDVVDDVAGVFFERVVDAGFEVGLRAVVIDAETAAYI